MGLDMYLYGSLSTYKYDCGQNKIDNEELHKFLAEKLKGYKPCENLASIDVRFEIGYWRKANQIHAWFVKNVQDGKDECELVGLGREELVALRDLCKQVLAMKGQPEEKIREKLPPQDGFFFGGTDIDKWYWGDLEHTIKVCDYALSLPERVSFAYQSSW